MLLTVDATPPAPAEQPTQNTTSIVTYPTIGRPVSRDDWYLLWGPLGFGWGLAAIIVAVLWRRMLAERRETAEKDKEHAKALAEEHRVMRQVMESHAEKLEELGREHAGQFQQTTEKLHALAVTLRDALDATSRRVTR
jgi:hypothetical protein